MAMSKRCIPYTPRFRDLKDTVFALVTTAGVHLRDQEPFDPAGDNSWRLIPGGVETGQLMVTHEHYDHRDADADINVVFPIDRLRELAAEGIIGGVSDKHLGFMGYTQQFRDLYERAAPEIARIISRSKSGWRRSHGWLPVMSQGERHSPARNRDDRHSHRLDYRRPRTIPASRTAALARAVPLQNGQ